MNAKSLVKTILASGLLASPLTWAAPVAVQGGVIFVLSNGALLTAPLSPTATLPAACPASFPAPGATDVVVSRNRAVVTPGIGGTPFSSFDVSACLLGFSGAGNTNVDLRNGKLEILCANVFDGNQDNFYHVFMQQRGSSQNWEVTFAAPDPNCSGSDN